MQLNVNTPPHVPCYQYDMHKQGICPKCRGSGAKSAADMKPCPVCKGQGKRVMNIQIMPGFTQQVLQPYAIGPALSLAVH